MLIRVVKMSSFHIASLLIRWNPSAGVNHQMRIVDIWSRSTWICSLEGSKLTLTVPRAKSKWLWNCWRSRKVVRFSCLHFFFLLWRRSVTIWREMQTNWIQKLLLWRSCHGRLWCHRPQPRPQHSHCQGPEGSVKNYIPTPVPHTSIPKIYK